MYASLDCHAVRTHSAARRRWLHSVRSLTHTKRPGHALLRQAFGCPKKMSAIAILDYRGAEDQYRRVEALAAQGRAAWRLCNANLAAMPGALPTQVREVRTKVACLWSLRRSHKTVGCCTVGTLLCHNAQCALAWRVHDANLSAAGGGLLTVRT